MKTSTLLFLLILAIWACKNEPKTTATENDIQAAANEAVKDSVIEELIKPVAKTTKQIKEELDSKGFKTFDYVDENTKDTIIMQQYFMAFLKKGAIRGQNEEETAELQKAHLAHLTKMYEMGYADISGPFGDEGVIRGITIYNVPTLKMADSLANADPMVKAGRLEIEIHPWWAGKGFPLR
ncbi:YciI family protein [Tamlana sp. 2201CG12-4]|uniref:YciI family protein n=1 Tax=Tamlana sp. 2201CG12-4 TaxID=3112582 RepID=UPI002DBE93A8|nr:YciI family protein [Tamlana sp. 2201CG12-4]MEC3906038.1 YciI family protein [Tamlana sp. 2201CG12-4]